MVLQARELYEVVGELRREREAEQGRLSKISSFLHDRHVGGEAGVYVPRRATNEYKMIVEQARFNVLDLVVTAVAQNLFVDGFRPTGPNGRAPTADNAPIWDLVWQPNRMDARQSSLYRTAITYGTSYTLVLPGDPVPVITPMSPMDLTALYVDPVNDEWPEVAMEFDRSMLVNGRMATIVRVIDNEAIYTLDTTDPGQPAILDVEVHELGVTPVVRFLDRYDLGGSVGKVEPLIPIQQQLNQTTFGLLMAQQFAAFKQRWVTGMEIQEDENGNPVEPFNAAVNMLFHAESPDTKFGEFGQTDLKGYLDSRDKALLHVASVAQIPPHNLLVGAGISNISAEALAALEAGHRQDIAEHQVSFGESVEQMLRLAALCMDDMGAWFDTSAQVVWRDTTPRSLSQVADALGKLATQLGIPVRALWERIPGVTDQDIARWESLASEQDILSELTSMLDQEGDVGEQPGSPAIDTPASA